MDLLLLLQAFGNYPPPDSQAAQFDFNNNGVIDTADFIHMLSLQPPISEDTTIYCTSHEETSRKSSLLQGSEVHTH